MPLYEHGITDRHGYYDHTDSITSWRNSSMSPNEWDFKMYGIEIYRKRVKLYLRKVAYTHNNTLDYEVLLSHMYVAICSGNEHEIVMYAKEIDKESYPIMLWDYAYTRAVFMGYTTLDKERFMELLEEFTSDRPWILVPDKGYVSYFNNPSVTHDVLDPPNLGSSEAYWAAALHDHADRELLQNAVKDKYGYTISPNIDPYCISLQHLGFPPTPK